MSAHTAGPWLASPYSSTVGCVITAQPDPSRNAVRVASVRGHTREEVEANAILISAAPGMLAALKQIKRDNQQYNFGSKLVRIVEAAIAAAEAQP